MTENKELINGCFYVYQKTYGSWYSTDKDGSRLVTSFTEESCISATHFYLKQRQERLVATAPIKTDATDIKTHEGEI